jgi:hypothetical protein
VTVRSDDTPFDTFAKKSSWPIPHPLITPRPVTTTRFFSAFSCVAEEEEREEREDNDDDDDDDDDCDVNAPTAEMPTTIRLGVANFILYYFGGVFLLLFVDFVFCGFVLWTARAGGSQYGDKWAGERFYEDSPTPDAVTSAFMVVEDDRRSGSFSSRTKKGVTPLRRPQKHALASSLFLDRERAILGL